MYTTNMKSLKFMEEPTLTLAALKALLEYKLFDQDALSILSDSSGSSVSLVSLRTKSRKLISDINATIREEIDTEEIFRPEKPREMTMADKYIYRNNEFAVPPIRQVVNVLNGYENFLDLTAYRLDETNLYLTCEALIGPPASPIVSLNLSKCPFGKDACITLSRFIEQSGLKILNLSNCLIGEEGIAILSDGIGDATNLVELNMCNCNLRDPGCMSMTIALSFNESIKILDLSKNKLHTGAAVELGKMLKVNNTLEVLNLSWNDLYPELECVKLLVGMKKNKSLLELNLSWNGLSGSRIGRSIGGLIKRHKTLLRINLEYNCFREEDLVAIIQSTKRGKELEEIYLGGNYWTTLTMKLFITPPFKNMKILSYGEYFYMPTDVYNLSVQVRYSNPKLKIIYKDKVLPNPPEPVDFNKIVLDRCKFLAMKPKKKSLKRDMGHFMIELQDNSKDLVTLTEFADLLKKFKAKLDGELIQHLTDCYTIKTKVGKRKVKRVDIKEMSSTYLASHPTERPPPPKPKTPKKSKNDKAAKVVFSNSQENERNAENKETVQKTEETEKK